jgi:hypothetical protein
MRMKNTIIEKSKSIIAKLNVFVIGYSSICMCYAAEFTEHHQTHCAVTAVVYGMFAAISLFHKAH